MIGPALVIYNTNIISLLGPNMVLETLAKDMLTIITSSSYLLHILTRRKKNLNFEHIR